LNAETLMIENPKIAKQISALMLECGARLDASVELVRDTCTADELKVYRRAIGKVMGEMLLEILNPLYEKHSSLKPGGLR
jgi:hypothetical protein